VGLKAIAVVAAALAGALALPGPVDHAADYLATRQQPDGGFAEPGRQSDPSLTAWAVLGLAAAGREPARAIDYFAARTPGAAIDIALRALALRSLGRGATNELDRLNALRRADGRIGPLVNSTIWSVLALRSAGRRAGVATVRYLLRRQTRNGGWSWAPRGAPDSNDTAAAVQALRAAGIGKRARALRRAFVFLRRLQNRDGGFALVAGRASDAQSTAWALQAYASAGRRPPRRARSFLVRMQRANGSFRYSSRYAVTPAWVTAQAIPALAGRPFPLTAPR
jgi:iron complex transport system substrate-binding protein